MQLLPGLGLIIKCQQALLQWAASRISSPSTSHADLEDEISMTSSSSSSDIDKKEKILESDTDGDSTESDSSRSPSPLPSPSPSCEPGLPPPEQLPDGRYRCPLKCNLPRTYARPADATRHASTSGCPNNVSVVGIICPLCNNKFSRKDALNRHRMTNHST